MLKIKEEVDLKELERFGFVYETDEDEEYWCKYLSDNEHKLFIYEDDRKILQGKFQLIYGFAMVDLDEKWIQDIIQAGLVEKVEG
jgi:hypothetical protein